MSRLDLELIIYDAIAEYFEEHEMDPNDLDDVGRVYDEFETLIAAQLDEYVRDNETDN